MSLTSRRSALGAIAARAVSILASFLLTFIVARVLDVGDAGTFFLVFTSIAIVATFGRFGTDNLALKIVGRADSNVLVDLRRLALIALAASVMGAGIGATVSSLSGIALPGAASTLLLAASAVIPQAIAVLAGSILRARGRLISGTFAELGSMPALTAVGIAFLFMTGEVALESVLFCLVAGSWTTAVWSVLAALLSCRTFSPEKAVAPVSATRFIRENSRALTAMMGTSLIFYLVTWIPIYILSAVGEIEAVSYYTAAARLAGFIGLIPAIQVSYLAPTFARLHQRSDVAGLNKLAGRSALTALGLAALPASILAIWAGPILGLLYGSPYEEGGFVLSLLTVGVIVSVAAGQVNQLMLLCDLEQFALWLNAGLLALWLVAGFASAAQFGLAGVVVVSVTLTIGYQFAAVVKLHSAAGILPFAHLTRHSS